MSERAVEAALQEAQGAWDYIGGLTEREGMTELLKALTDPKLGESAYVRLGTVLTWLEDDCAALTDKHGATVARQLAQAVHEGRL